MRVVKLCAGEGDGVTTACLMTASNMLIGKPEDGDHNHCVCKMLRSFIIQTNDRMPDHLRNELYGPLVWEILGTATDDIEVVVARAKAFAQWALQITAAGRAAYSAGRAARAAYSAYSADAAAGRAAAYSAARAAADAADAAAARTAAGRPIWESCVQIIREVAAIGDRRPVETVLTHEQLCEALNK